MIKSKKGNKKNSYKVQAVISSFILVFIQISLTYAETTQPTTATTTQPTGPVSVFRPYQQIVKPNATVGTVTTISTVSTPTNVTSPATILTINEDPDSEAGSSSVSSFPTAIGPTSPLSQVSSLNTVFETPTTNSAQTSSSASNIFLPNQPANTTIQQPAEVGDTTTTISQPANTGGNSSTSTTNTDVDEIVSNPANGAQTSTGNQAQQTTQTGTQNPPTESQFTTNTNIQTPPTGTVNPPTGSSQNTNLAQPQTDGDPDGNAPVTPQSTAPPPSTSNTIPDATNVIPTTPFLGDAFNRIGQKNEGGGGGGSSGPFLGDYRRAENPYVSRSSISDDNSRFVGGGVDMGNRILRLILGKDKPKTMVEITEEALLEEKIEGKKTNKNNKKLFKKLNQNQESEQTDEKEQILKQAGAVDADLSNLEGAESSEQNVDQFQKSPLDLEVISDLVPVHGFKSSDFIPNSPRNIQPERPQGIHRSPLKRVAENVFLPKNAYQAVQVAKIMSPSMIHRIHKIASPDESGIRIENGSNLEDVDL